MTKNNHQIRGQGPKISPCSVFSQVVAPLGARWHRGTKLGTFVPLSSVSGDICSRWRKITTRIVIRDSNLARGLLLFRFYSSTGACIRRGSVTCGSFIPLSSVLGDTCTKSRNGTIIFVISGQKWVGLDTFRTGTQKMRTQPKIGLWLLPSTRFRVLIAVQ